MPNDAGRHLVAFALGMRCFTCLGTSENPTRHLPAAGSVCKSQSVFKLLPGRLPWAVQKAVLAADLGLQQGREGLEGTTCQPVPYKNHPSPQASPWPPPTGSLSPAAAHRAVTTSHPLLQHCLGLTLIVLKKSLAQSPSHLHNHSTPVPISAHTSCISRAQGPFTGQGSDPCGWEAAG